MSPSHNNISRHLFLLHSAIRITSQRILSAIHNLTPLAPDAILDDIAHRFQHLTSTVLAHCLIEDQTIIPAIQDALSAHNRKSSSPERPAKRPRGSSSPVAITLDGFQDDHQHLHNAFRSLRKAIDDLRAAPLLRGHRLSPRIDHHKTVVSDPPQLHLPRAHQSTNTALTRQEGITRVKEAADSLGKILRDHLENEEIHIFPACIRCLSIPEQAQLVVRAVQASIAVPVLPDSFRLVHDNDLVSLFRILAQYCNNDEFKRIALALAHVFSVDQWRFLSSKVPKLAEMVLPKRNPLIQITQIHTAIEKELTDLIAHSKSIDMADPKQLQTLAARFQFLERVHGYHSEGEESVLLKELHARIHGSPSSTTTNAFHEEHNDESVLFAQMSDKLSALRTRVCRVSPDETALQYLKKELVDSVQAIADHLIEHMRGEETNLLPLVRQYFSLDDQDRLMRRVMAMVPAEFLAEVIPWMFNSLEVDDQESMMRNLLNTAPHNEFGQVVEIIARSMRKGSTDRLEWNEVCLRVPEIEERYKGVIDKDDKHEIGPVSEILRVHKAFRIELNALLRRSKDISADGATPNPHALLSLAESVAFLRKMVEDHSAAEDNILLPRLDERAPGVSEKYKSDHCDERKLFQDLAECLEELQCASEEKEFVRLVLKLQVLARTLRDEMENHLTQEEEQMWPLLQELFSAEEQYEIVSLIFGQMSCSRLRELLPWMIRILSVSERNTMMNHILQITQSTMFEKWLTSWLPIDDDKDFPVDKQNQAKKEQTPRVSLEAPRTVNTALALLRGRENIERTIRAIARDSSLSVEDRTRMMQQVMLAPYRQFQESSRDAGKEVDDRRKTYVTDKNGNRRLGCKHYIRACKIRAVCCNRLYTCRLCHDDAEKTHIMDRSATTEILCMRCDTLQPVSAKCINDKCAKPLAAYFCSICVFYDDDESRSVYHCHSCNVCRVGKGLGVDYFHCMKCNQCMSMKYQKKGHVCIEKSMESNCPVCYQYLFTSTSPVKYLRCGHLMHTSCFKRYCRDHMSCPVCSKSLEEITPVFERLDAQLATNWADSMPPEYRSARCDIFCLDCHQTSNTPYHFLYNKCPKCSSYNTRVEYIDANAGERHCSALNVESD